MAGGRPLASASWALLRSGGTGGALAASSEGFSGAEIEQAVIVSLYRCLHESREPDTALSAEEMAATVPLSVSRREDVERLRATARERFVPV